MNDDLLWELRYAMKHVASWVLAAAAIIGVLNGIEQIERVEITIGSPT